MLIAALTALLIAAIVMVLRRVRNRRDAAQPTLPLRPDQPAPLDAASVETIDLRPGRPHPPTRGRSPTPVEAAHTLGLSGDTVAVFSFLESPRDRSEKRAAVCGLEEFMKRHAAELSSNQLMAVAQMPNFEKEYYSDYYEMWFNPGDCSTLRALAIEVLPRRKRRFAAKRENNHWKPRSRR